MVHTPRRGGWLCESGEDEPLRPYRLDDLGRREVNSESEDQDESSEKAAKLCRHPLRGVATRHPSRASYLRLVTMKYRFPNFLPNSWSNPPLPPRGAGRGGSRRARRPARTLHLCCGWLVVGLGAGGGARRRASSTRPTTRTLHHPRTASGYSPGTHDRSTRRPSRSTTTLVGIPTGSCVSVRCRSSTFETVRPPNPTITSSIHSPAF